MSRRTTAPMSIAAAGLAAAGLVACGSSSKDSATASSPPPATTAAAKTAAAPAAAAPAGGHARTVAVALSEYAIRPAVTSAPAGRVVFDVTNTGKIKHQFTIIRTNKSAATVLSKQDPNDDIPGARGEISSLAPGARKTLVIKHLKPGHYAMVCALPGHYQSGMHADFTVR